MRRSMATDATQILGRMILVLGILLAAAGLLLLFGPRLPGYFGRLPGDITMRRGNMHVYIPLGTCIVLSLVLTLVLSLISWWRR
jgi:DUF2905 family protein